VVVVLLALAVDLAVGDPPNRVHPVAWAGRLLAHGRRRLCLGSSGALRLKGAALTLAVTGLAGAAGALVGALALRLGATGLVLEALALSTVIAARGLVGAAREVHAALGRGDLAGARERVAWHLVSRPTHDLDEGHVASAAVESVAENLTDALVAPLCWYLVLGLPGAAAYRAVNTADAMLGYRTGPLEHFGKLAARLDDVLNWVPARLAGLALVGGAALAGERGRAALAVMRRDRGRTTSPNAGWTMSAMAGALGVALEKPAAYRLGDGALAAAADIPRALHVLGAALVLAVLGLLGITWAIWSFMPGVTGI
jgi:adenosylcobinamide-phosphate synthase